MSGERDGIKKHQEQRSKKGQRRLRGKRRVSGGLRSTSPLNHCPIELLLRPKRARKSTKKFISKIGFVFLSFFFFSSAYFSLSFVMMKR